MLQTLEKPFKRHAMAPGHVGIGSGSESKTTGTGWAMCITDLCCLDMILQTQTFIGRGEGKGTVMVWKDFPNVAPHQ